MGIGVFEISQCTLLDYSPNSSCQFQSHAMDCTDLELTLTPYCPFTVVSMSRDFL